MFDDINILRSAYAKIERMHFTVNALTKLKFWPDYLKQQKISLTIQYLMIHSRFLIFFKKSVKDAYALRSTQSEFRLKIHVNDQKTYLCDLSFEA